MNEPFSFQTLIILSSLDEKINPYPPQITLVTAAWWALKTFRHERVLLHILIVVSLLAERDLSPKKGSQATDETNPLWPFV